MNAYYFCFPNCFITFKFCFPPSLPYKYVDVLSSCLESLVGDTVGDPVVLMSQTGQLSNGCGSTEQLDGIA